MSDEHRRRFLGWLGASTVLAALGSRAIAQSARRDSTASSSRAPTSDKWDLSWVDKLHGDARSVFDIPAPEEGDGVWRAQRWREDYAKLYGVKQSELGAVLVIRHKAIPLIMDNEYWSRFEVGKKLEIKDPRTGKWIERNPVSRAGGSASTGHEQYTIESILATGGIVLACNMAFQGLVVPAYQTRDKLSAEAAEARAREHVLPGVILQPSGIFATLRAQQAGCAYVLAS